MLCLVAGVIPGTQFACMPRYAPRPQAVTTTVGLVQQGAGMGQVLLPPLVAWVAAASGGWSLTWVVTGAFAPAVLVLAGLLALPERRAGHGGRGGSAEQAARPLARGAVGPGGGLGARRGGLVRQARPAARTTRQPLAALDHPPGSGARREEREGPGPQRPRRLLERRPEEHEIAVA